MERGLAGYALHLTVDLWERVPQTFPNQIKFFRVFIPQADGKAGEVGGGVVGVEKSVERGGRATVEACLSLNHDAVTKPDDLVPRVAIKGEAEIKSGAIEFVAKVVKRDMVKGCDDAPWTAGTVEPGGSAQFREVTEQGVTMKVE